MKATSKSILILAGFLAVSCVVFAHSSKPSSRGLPISENYDRRSADRSNATDNFMSLQTPVLQTGGDEASGGTITLKAGFTPDPHTVKLTGGGGPLDASKMQLGWHCGGWVSARPNYIVRLDVDVDAKPELMRFYLTSESATNIIVYHNNGYWCSDGKGSNGTNRDNFKETNGGTKHPVIDIGGGYVRPGQYDVWVGSRENGRAANAVLYVTTKRERHP